MIVSYFQNNVCHLTCVYCMVLEFKLVFVCIVHFENNSNGCFVHCSNSCADSWHNARCDRRWWFWKWQIV